MMENEGDEDGGWPAGPGGCVPMCQLMLLLLSYAFVVAGFIFIGSLEPRGSERIGLR